jgi:Tol biopolymer transport system component
MLDETPSPLYDGIAVGSPVFSPDGTHIAYAAQFDGKWQVLVDGKPGPGFDAVGNRFFSPDSVHLVYAAQRGNKQLLVVDGTPGPAYDRMMKGSRIVFDSPNVLHTLAWRDNTVYHVELTIAK